MNNTRVFRFLSIALLAAIALYFAAQGYFALTDPFTTTLVYQSSAEDTIDVSGWLVRDEEVLSGESGTVRHEVSEGERVGKGQTVATVYSGSDALDTVQQSELLAMAEQIEAKELQLQQLQFALSSYLNPDATLKLDGSITESLLNIRRSLSGGDYDDAADQTAQLKAAILKRSHTYSSGEEIEADIATVQGELSALRSSLSGARTVTAEHSGTYSAACDGYESLLTPDFLQSVTPSQLEGLPSGQTGGSSLGKLIIGEKWYYTAVITAEQAQQLEKGDWLTLRFSKGAQQDIDAQVTYLSAAEDGKQAVVLTCREYLAQTTQLRHQAAQLVLRSYEGLRIPTNALRMSEDNQLGVYCVVGKVASFKPVSMVYRGDGYSLVQAASPSQDVSVLRPGDEVIVTSSKLSGGQIVQ